MAHDRARESQPADIGLWAPLLALLFIGALVFVGGYLAFVENRRSTEHEVQQDLLAVARLKVTQIDQWRRARLSDGRLVAGSVFFAGQVAAWLVEGAPADGRRALLQSRLEAFLRLGHYRSVTLVDGRGQARLSTGGGVVLSEPERNLAVSAMAAGEVMLSDLHEGGRGVEMNLVVPLALLGQKVPQIGGAVVFEIDPDQFLYPLVQSWPTGSRSAETTLVRREGDHVLWLNRLRHRKGEPLTFRLPLTETAVPAVNVALGLQGVSEGVDYRGVSVVAATLKIPDSPWGMVAKMDRDEIYAPIHRLQAWVGAMAVAFLVLAGMLIVLWTQWQHVRYRDLQARCRAEAEGRAFAKRYETLARYANDIILMFDVNGRVIDANERACEVYGYSREELLRLAVWDFRAPDSPYSPEERSDRMKQIGVSGGATFETRHRRKDGSVFPVEVSARMMAIDGERFTQGIIRDITERRRAEEALRTYAAEVEDLYNHAPVGYHSLDKDGVIVRVNDTELSWLGYTREEVIGRMRWIDMLTPGSAQIFHANYTGFKERGWVRDLEYEVRRKDGSVFPILLSATVVRDSHGNFLMTRSTSYDITQRRQAEDEIRRSHAQLRELMAHLGAVREEERCRISREIHDELGQVLTGLKLNVGWLGEKLVEARHPLASRVLKMAEIVDRAIESARGITARLRPDVLDQLGLVAAIQWQVQEFISQTGIACELEIFDEDLVVDGLLATTVFRILQEALNNVAKHAEASSVSVTLDKKGELLTLRVKDEGKGFDPASHATGKSFGLLGIRERALMVGGHVRINAKPGKGAEILVQVPMDIPSSGESGGRAA